MIDADALPIWGFPQSWEEGAGTRRCCEAVKNAPTIDAEPVRRGHCYVDSVGYERCSVCNESEFNMRYFRFCPHCGARMDNETEGKQE